MSYVKESISGISLNGCNKDNNEVRRIEQVSGGMEWKCRVCRNNREGWEGTGTDREMAVKISTQISAGTMYIFKIE